VVAFSKMLSLMGLCSTWSAAWRSARRGPSSLARPSQGAFDEVALVDHGHDVLAQASLT
jgi:hypothetical protein